MDVQFALSLLRIINIDSFPKQWYDTGMEHLYNRWQNQVVGVRLEYNGQASPDKNSVLWTKEEDGNNVYKNWESGFAAVIEIDMITVWLT